MASNPYKSPLIILPADLQVVWIMLYNQFTPRVQATFHLGSLEFVTTITNLTIPAYLIQGWKP